MNKGAVNYIVRVAAQKFLGVICFAVGAWGKISLWSGMYFIFYVLLTFISCMVMYKKNPGTLSERRKVNTNSPNWDKVLLGVYWLLTFFVIYVVAGMEQKESKMIRIGLYGIGMALQIVVSVVTLYALMVNTYLESTARIQTDRGQQVCTRGPYHVIRHPMYAAILVWCSSVVLIFQTAGVFVIAAIIAGVIILRTYLEDKMLREQLVGYEAYATEVRYRLIPWIW